ncbi:MAG: YkgJ family cysteine cluster protein [Armatimonadetes bacterium]|nr:YkgJ family cysteine cluster protein [Armatimonadota bacterium]
MNEHFTRLNRLYDWLEEEKLPRRNFCGQCANPGICCLTHLVILHELEYVNIRNHLMENGRDRDLPAFIPIPIQEFAEGRVRITDWSCPLYSSSRFCTIYPVRPFACRVFGHFIRSETHIPECTFKDAVRYDDDMELDFMPEYVKTIRDYSPRVGYLLPRPALTGDNIEAGFRKVAQREWEARRDLLLGGSIFGTT